MRARAARPAPRSTASIWSLRLAAVAVITTLTTLVGAASGTVRAHDDIESSTPANRSTIDEPISMVEIDFGEVIDPATTSLFVTYGLPDGDVEEVESTTTVTGETIAVAEFDEIDRKGTYFVQYLAPVPSDGHVIAGAISFTWGAATAIVDSNPDIRSSTPGSREVLDEPITSADIEFELEITDLEMELIYDQGDGENFDPLGGEAEQTGPRTATFRWDALPSKGTYFMSYTATATVDDEEVAGAIPFVWGSPSSNESSFPWLWFVPLAIIVLGIGAYFSRRMMLVADDDAADAEAEDDELTTV